MKKVIFGLGLVLMAELFFSLDDIREISAAKPSDYGLKEGDLISAIFSDDPDVYIINEHGYKRLFLNPEIFKFYSHLGGFANIKLVTPEVRDSFPTVGLFRNCEKNDSKVYGFESDKEDEGKLRWINTTGEKAVKDDLDFFKKVFCINDREFRWYKRGEEFKSVKDVPQYRRSNVLTLPITSAATPTIPVSHFQPLVSMTPSPVPASSSFVSTPIPSASPATSAQPPATSSTPTVAPTSTPISTPTPAVSSSPIAPSSFSPTPTPTSSLTPVSTQTPTISGAPAGALIASNGTWCYSSDGDSFNSSGLTRDYFNKGYCQDNTGYYSSDYCSGDTLREYYCNRVSAPAGSAYQYSYVGCWYSDVNCSGILNGIQSVACADGACVSGSTPTPTPVSPAASVSYTPQAKTNFFGSMVSVGKSLFRIFGR